MIVERGVKSYFMIEEVHDAKDDWHNIFLSKCLSSHLCESR